MKTLNKIINTCLLTTALGLATYQNADAQTYLRENSMRWQDKHTLSSHLALPRKGNCISEDGKIVPCKEAMPGAELEARLTVDHGEFDVEVDFVYTLGHTTPAADNAWPHLSERMVSSKVLNAYVLPNNKRVYDLEFSWDHELEYKFNDDGTRTLSTTGKEQLSIVNKAKKLANELIDEYLRETKR